MSTPNNNPTQDEQLNPFVFPTETDGRFLLLVMMIAGMALGLILNLLYFYTRIESGFVLLAIAVGGVSLFFLWTRRQTAKVADDEIESREWSSFPPSATDLSEQNGLSLMQENIGQTTRDLPEIEEHTPPQFIWDDDDHALSGRAFGYGERQFVLLPRGMYDAFVLRYKSYQAILLHELAHIANRDVSRTAFSIQLGRNIVRLTIFCVALFYFYITFVAVRNSLTGGPFASIWTGFQFLSEATVKLLLGLLLIEAIRSSVLRVREYYADARAAMWTGSESHLRAQILADDNGVVSPPGGGQRSLRGWFRNSVAPLHPNTEQRLMVLNDTRELFRPSLEIAVFSGLLMGFTINGNFSIVSKLIPYMMTFSNTLVDPIAQGATNSIIPLVLSRLVDIGTIVFIAALFVIFGAFPIAATVGMQIQKAAFADKSSIVGNRLASTSKLLLISFLLSLGAVIGFILTPFPEALSIGSQTVRAGSLFLTPVILMGWSILFFMWLLPLRGLAGPLYVSHADDHPPTRKRKWLTAVSVLMLLPTLFTIILTQIIVTSSTFLAGLTADNFTLITSFIIASWGIATILTFLIWWIARFVMSRRGWMRPIESAQTDIPAWARLPAPITLPAPPSFPPPSDAPPSL